MNWWPVYGTFVSLMSMGAVVIMVRTTRQQARAIRALHIGMQHMVIAASNMWDTLTPEQIRTLHPATIEVGNGVPPWDVVTQLMHEDDG